jgi:hypothetical protein
MESIHSPWTIGPRVVDSRVVHKCRRIIRRTRFVSKLLTFPTCQRLLYQQCLQQVIAESKGMVQWLQAAAQPKLVQSKGMVHLQAAAQPKLVHRSVSSVRPLGVAKGMVQWLQAAAQPKLVQSKGMVQLQAAAQPKLVHRSVSSVRPLGVGIDSTSRSQVNRISISSSSRPFITLLISAYRAVRERWAWRQALPRSLRIHSIITSSSSRSHIIIVPPDCTRQVGRECSTWRQHLSRSRVCTMRGALTTCGVPTCQCHTMLPPHGARSLGTRGVRSLQALHLPLCMALTRNAT